MESDSEDESPNMLLYKAKDFTMPYAKPANAVATGPRERSKVRRGRASMFYRRRPVLAFDH